MRPRLYTVTRAGAGRLSIMARPRGGDWLVEELYGLRRIGVEVLVCALTDVEQVELGLAEEATACTTAGLEFVAIPIPDRGVPDEQALRSVLDRLHAAVTAGRHVVIHCRAGIGRASLLAGALLVGEGLDPEQAWQRLVRPGGCPFPTPTSSANGCNASPGCSPPCPHERLAAGRPFTRRLVTRRSCRLSHRPRMIPPAQTGDGMDREQFWALIEAAKAATGGDCQALRAHLVAALGERSVNDVLAWDRIHGDLMAESYRRDLWGAAYLINGGCSDDGFDYFRSWLLGQGTPSGRLPWLTRTRWLTTLRSASIGLPGAPRLP
jgi:protein tyrosine phosphatase (PTP) superfamily phosphohydrolase (DUF442 family)